MHYVTPSRFEMGWARSQLKIKRKKDVLHISNSTRELLTSPTRTKKLVTRSE
jgi:hypothetical protein